MLKIVYPICCGIDVHKKFVVATIATTSSDHVTTYQTNQFSTFTDDLLLLASWLKENNCIEVCMEFTGKYWIPIFNVLEISCHVLLANPKFIKAIPGKKKSVHISKAGSYLKPVLVQCALSSIKQKNSPFKGKYERIKRRRGHKRALISIAQTMLTCIYHVLSKNEDFKHNLYLTSVIKEPSVTPSVYQLKQAILFYNTMVIV